LELVAATPSARARPMNSGLGNRPLAKNGSSAIVRGSVAMS
jgi:hypothetical protein